MRLARAVLFALVPIVLAGCFTQASRSRSINPFPLLGGGQDPDSALVKYVVIERKAGSEEINRQAWARVDEQILPFETRKALEQAGLRVGVTGESAPGELRRLIDEPRTKWGHRVRTFGLDSPAPLILSTNLPHVEFSLPGPNGEKVPFVKDGVVLGFDITVRDGKDGKMVVKFVPRARFSDPTQLMPADIADRGLGTQTFPAAGVEIAIAPNEYLVIGTDNFWRGTFGHATFTDVNEDRPVQRMLVLSAFRNRASGLPEGEDAPPLASQTAIGRSGP
jgi:hypothetical protein